MGITEKRNNLPRQVDWRMEFGQSIILVLKKGNESKLLHEDLSYFQSNTATLKCEVNAPLLTPMHVKAN